MKFKSDMLLVKVPDLQLLILQINMRVVQRERVLTDKLVNVMSKQTESLDKSSTSLCITLVGGRSNVRVLSK